MSKNQLIRADPRYVRDVLDEAAANGIWVTAQKHGLHHSTIFRWRTRREADPAWPDDQYVEAWLARETAQQHRRALNSRYLSAVYLNGGPLMVDPTGTTRRLQALCALGWTNGDIAARMGVSKARVGHLANGMWRRLHASTADAVARVYDELSMTVPTDPDVLPPKHVRVHDRQRRQTAARGWVPPLAWDDDTIDDPDASPATGLRLRTSSTRYDETVVDRILSGDWHLTSSRPEREEVVARWRTAGRPLVELEQLTGWNVRRYYDLDDSAVA